MTREGKTTIRGLNKSVSITPTYFTISLIPYHISVCVGFHQPHFPINFTGSDSRTREGKASIHGLDQGASKIRTCSTIGLIPCHITVGVGFRQPHVPKTTIYKGYLSMTREDKTTIRSLNKGRNLNRTSLCAFIGLI